jgi:hypothetical protein
MKIEDMLNIKASSEPWHDDVINDGVITHSMYVAGSITKYRISEAVKTMIICSKDSWFHKITVISWTHVRRFKHKHDDSWNRYDCSKGLFTDQWRMRDLWTAVGVWSQASLMSGRDDCYHGDGVY